MFDFTLPGGDPADGIFFDAALSVRHSRQAQVTDFPVEDGADVSDNIRIGPATVIIDGIMSNISAGLFDAYGELAAASDIFNLTRARDAYARLLLLYEQREPCVLTTEVQLYAKGLITSLDMEEALENGDAIRFTATWREVIFARSEVLDLEEEPGAPPKKAQVDVGAKAAAAAPPADVSILKEVVQGVKDTVKQVAPMIPAPL